MKAAQNAVQNFLDGFFVIVVNDHFAGVEAMFDAHVHRATGPFGLVPMRRMDHHRQVELFRELQLSSVVLVLKGGLLVVSDLANGDDTFFGGEARQDLHHGFCEFFIIRFFAIETHRAVVTDTELARSEALPAHEA